MLLCAKGKIWTWLVSSLVREEEKLPLESIVCPGYNLTWPTVLLNIFGFGF